MQNQLLPPSSDHVPTTKHSRILAVCGAFVVMGLVLFWNYYAKEVIGKSGKSTQAEDKRPPYAGKLKTNLELERDTGEKVNFGQLEGKVWIVAYVYTRCPRGCSMVADVLKKFHDRYSSNPLFRTVAITLYPEEDTPEFLKGFREAKGMTGDRYWFLRGNGDAIRGYMKDEFKLIVTEVPKAEQTNPYDRWNHKLAIVLVDHQLRIRRTADFGESKLIELWEKQLDTDLQYVLKEAEGDLAPAPAK